MTSKLNISFTMLQKMLDAMDASAFTFDRHRKTIYANKMAQELLRINASGNAVGAAEENHFDNHEYYDEDGNRSAYPNGSALERAFEGHATHDLVLEHRNLKEHKNQWLSISCIPVMDADGEFEYGILWYRDITKQKNHEHQLQFLLKSMQVLSITEGFEERIQEKARLAIPVLADWCSIEVVTAYGSTKRVALIHRDPSKIELIKEYERKYPSREGVETSVQQVVRTGKFEFIPQLTADMIDATPHLSKEQREDIKRLQLSSLITIPISMSGKVLGTLSLAYAESGRVYTEEDLRFFEEFAGHLSILLENAQLYKEIKERDLSKDAFFAALSHELRNPLAPIKFAVDLLSLHNKDETLNGEIEIIDHQFGHLARLLNELLDTNRFITGKLNLEMQTIELVSLLRSVVTAHQPVAQAAEVELIASYPDFPIFLSADKTRIEQGVINVLNNAIKFSPKGSSISLSVSADDHNAIIKIKDVGSGITAEEMPFIFEPYYQSERIRNLSGGLGVGLRLVQEIIRLHGGSVKASSDGAGLGSEFTVSLPRKVVENTITPESLPKISALDSGTILVIDDNQPAADAMVRLLKALGWNAHGLYSAKDALAYLEEHTVTTIFMDIGMPEMNGYELVRLLRQKGHTELPIIALTGYGFEADSQKALEAGFTAHLTKPIGSKELNEILQKVSD